MTVSAPILNPNNPLGFSTNRTRWTIGIIFLISIAIHFLVGVIATKIQPFQAARVSDSRLIDVDLYTSNRPPVTETLQQESKEAPTDAKFESSRNLKTDEETSPTRAPMNIPNKGGEKRQQEKAARPRSQPRSTEKLFSLKQEQLIADGSLQQETLRPDGQGADSTGFEERLRVGTDLKVNAKQSDYAQFINRMREKLSQHWAPKNTITNAMYRYKEIRVDIAVVLNSKGEVVEIRRLGSSQFSEYDQEAERALRMAGPFPNPHKSLIQDDGFVYMPWSFTLYMDDRPRGSEIE